jgi:hypothetical protein
MWKVALPLKVPLALLLNTAPLMRKGRKAGAMVVFLLLALAIRLGAALCML